MKEIVLTIITVLLVSTSYANDRYPTSIEFNTVFSCMKSRVGGLKNLNNPIIYNRVLEQCSCYMDFLEKKYSLGEFMDLDSKIQKDPNGKEARALRKYVQETVLRECF